MEPPIDRVPSQDIVPQDPPPKPDKKEPEAIQKDIKKDAPSEKVEKSKTKERDVDIALKDPTVRNFMETFKAQILSVEQIKKTKK